MNDNHTRRRSRAFVATITPSTIEVKKSQHSAEYILCRDAGFQRPGDPPQVRTAMAFGELAQSVKSLLREGEPVTLAVQYDGATIKLLGPPREEQLASAARRLERVAA
ncbi:hypothetical protein [Sphingosinicella sp. BN140058]|uniref:hypothetical protein n=1 Tax=Sphingosinicella sp. BN140058 TaxID=1892855 RepID=UPI001011867A|nr:hypothetical protein [Sphingosinicella sp. BN140058]QAY80315.1 hypothetical protein ETR14_27105 [Sphingosinicella sp. BN140058]